MNDPTVCIKSENVAYFQRQDAIWQSRFSTKEKILLLAINYWDCWTNPREKVEELSRTTGLTQLDVQIQLACGDRVPAFISEVIGGEA